MPMFSRVPDWLAYVFTALIVFAILVLIFLLIDWLRLRRQLAELSERLAMVTRERDRNIRTLGSMDERMTLRRVSTCARSIVARSMRVTSATTSFTRVGSRVAVMTTGELCASANADDKDNAATTRPRCR